MYMYLFFILIFVVLLFVVNLNFILLLLGLDCWLVILLMKVVFFILVVFCWGENWFCILILVVFNNINFLWLLKVKDNLFREVKWGFFKVLFVDKILWIIN